MTPLDELIAKVEAATGGSRDLDWELHVLDGLWGVGAYGPHPHYTTNREDALSFVESKLPGCMWRIHRLGVGSHWAAVEQRGGPMFDAAADTAALAVIAASLRARKGQQEGEAG